MEPKDDPQLRAMLREWQVENAPASLDARVLGARRLRWRFLLTGSMRVPVPVALAFAAALILMGVALARQQRVVTAPTAETAINLADFQPVQDMKVRIIGVRQ